MEQDYVDKQIDAKIIEINNNENVYEIGTVVNVRDFIIEVTGISNVMFYEKINIANKAIGYVNSINESTVTVAVLKIDAPINVGDMVYSTNTLYQGSYSNSSIGRVIDIFGIDKLSNKKFSDLIEVPIERKTIPIMDRGTVNRPLLTGITGIDLMYPIGRGQRQLIIGDKRTGKTQIGLDTIVNQKDQNVLCFYVAIGKTKKEVKNIYAELMKKGALDYTTIITAFNDELPPVISLIPYFALSVAENYMMEGYDVLVVIDDLKRHAEAYREISLISGKTPGRDAYPADIFYTHSRLLEKGCQHKNGGSITILPIVETKGGDITDYISTNIISITDGQIVLSAKSFQKGEKPAIDYGLSVSRLGGAVQKKDMKVIGSAVRRKLLSYLETRSVYELVNMDEMSFELKNQFMEGKIILDNMMQYKFSPRTPEEMLDLFAGIVEINDDTEEKVNTEEIKAANDEVFENKTTIPEDGSIFDNTNVVDTNNNPTNEAAFDLSQLNSMPEEIANNHVEEVADEVPEIVPETAPIEVSEIAPIEEANPVSTEVVNEVPEIVPETAPIEVSEIAPVEEANPVSTEVVNEVPEIVPEIAPIEVSEIAPVEEANPVSTEVVNEVPEIVPETAPIEVSEIAPVEEANPVSTEVVNEVPEMVPETAPIEVSEIAPEMTVDTPETVPIEATDFMPFENINDEVKDNVDNEKVAEKSFSSGLLSDYGVEPADDLPIEAKNDIIQNVYIDNPQTEIDESVVVTSPLPEEVTIDINSNPLPEVDQSKIQEEVNTNLGSFDPFGLSISSSIISEDVPMIQESTIQVLPKEESKEEEVI